MRVRYLLLSTGDLKILFQADDRHGGYGVSQETATSTHHLLKYLDISQPSAKRLIDQSAKRSVSQGISQPSVSQQEERVITTWSVISYLTWEEQSARGKGPE